MPKETLATCQIKSMLNSMSCLYYANFHYLIFVYVIIMPIFVISCWYKSMLAMDEFSLKNPNKIISDIPLTQHILYPHAALFSILILCPIAVLIFSNGWSILQHLIYILQYFLNNRQLSWLHYIFTAHLI